MNSNILVEEKHKKANEYKNLCIFAEDAIKFPNNAKVFGKWIKKESFHEEKTNFKGILYSNGTEYVICYIGTDSKSVKDHIENIVMGVFGKSMQMRIANYFYKKCKEEFGFYDDNLTLIGHSEGGTEASYVGVKNNVKVVTFNPYGLSAKLYDKGFDYSNLITNYRDEADFVSKLKKNIGAVYIVPSVINQCLLKHYLGSIKSHKINNFGDCEKAISLEEYKKQHPYFIDTYKIFEK